MRLGSQYFAPMPVHGKVLSSSVWVGCAVNKVSTLASDEIWKMTKNILLLLLLNAV